CFQSCESMAARRLRQSLRHLSCVGILPEESPALNKKTDALRSAATKSLLRCCRVIGTDVLSGCARARKRAWRMAAAAEHALRPRERADHRIRQHAVVLHDEARGERGRELPIPFRAHHVARYRRQVRVALAQVLEQIRIVNAQVVEERDADGGIASVLVSD